MHSRPSAGIDNLGDAERLRIATVSLVNLVLGDPRIHEEYMVWRAALAPHLRALAAATVALDEIAVVLRLGEIVTANTEEGLGRLRLASASIGLDYDWLPPLLLTAFRLRFYDEASGEQTGGKLSLTQDARSTLRRGKAPRNAGADIERYVSWFFRAKVQQPPDSVAQIAREYAAQCNRRTDARSVVQNAIKQVEALLPNVVASLK